jgi:polysaccharide biosynthesis/export protein
MLKKSLVIIAGAAALTGCAATTAGLGDRDRLVVVPVPELPLPTGVNPFSDTRPYYLGPKDTISVNVYGEDRLSSPSIQVDGGGTIALPVVGEIVAQRRTTIQLARAIEDRLRTILVAPQVNVNILTPVSQWALVDGAVATPGEYPVVGRMTLQQLVAKAGGTDDYAVIEKTVIIRTVEDKTYAAIYNLRDVKQGTYPDPEIFAGDKVAIGDSAFRKYYNEFLKNLPILYLFTRN